ncbi:ppGpp synthetase catalytic domain-containing protein (RelA/SpoT-type nucleotidyltranferase) [Acetitomaculum ruminis DSM 5522]|uniref:PpGpp synthetase catalytic domain-containing protein (RelA/SpoT-type nucleotidyltranferase) n=1 Tax=Acetitomaculum ruminis DSM 5522 TaxID=1120918 RepID=A0A1I0YAA3_9FIRM|nr:GTP pyrophosphokinase [Acetitomaculum ruminis]SFB10269.1 ppGpp synthetase catalytic domain-containing protein (RelA/SpoT-type nucleotidyltranferase) [Acetitomaculum ruminis DSM 5522]
METLTESIYGSYENALRATMEDMKAKFNEIRDKIRDTKGEKPVDHILSRLKGEESMREKCFRKDYPVSTESAITRVKDAIGIRVVCSFIDDVYKVVDEIKKTPGWKVDVEKDYIRHAKANGYRSYHIILKVPNKYGGGDIDSFYAEIQIRTISMDTWASLEHQMRYKRNIKNQQLIEVELKRCADELASTDVSLQTIRDMITGDNEK